MNTSRTQLITSKIIKQSIIHLKSIQSVSETYLRFNPFLHEIQHQSLQQIQKIPQILNSHIRNFNNLLLKQKLAPPLFTCSLFESSMIFFSSFLPKSFQFSSRKSSSNSIISSNSQPLTIQSQYFHKKLLKTAEYLNDNLRELNQNQLQQKQLRESLIKARNDIEKVLKQINDKISQKVESNNLISKVFDYVV